MNTSTPVSNPISTFSKKRAASSDHVLDTASKKKEHPTAIMSENRTENGPDLQQRPLVPTITKSQPKSIDYRDLKLQAQSFSAAEVPILAGAQDKKSRVASSSHARPLAVTQLQHHGDLEVAKKMQEEEDRMMAEQMLQDEAIAVEEEAGFGRLDIGQLEQENYLMRSTPTGKAFLFVERGLSIVNQYREVEQPNHAAHVHPISTDDMVALVERFIVAQAEFRQRGVSGYIDHGFHNTTQGALDTIRTEGLLTKQERRDLQIGSRFGASHYGDGVYTADSPYAFRRHGPVGLFVARLRGKILRVGHGRHNIQAEKEHDSLVGNKDSYKLSFSNEKDEIVLKTSRQCLPLFRYNVHILPHVSPESSDVTSVIASLQAKMKELVDEFFNIRGEGPCVPDIYEPPIPIAIGIPTNPNAIAQSPGTVVNAAITGPMSLATLPYNASQIAAGLPLPSTQTHPAAIASTSQRTEHWTYVAPSQLLSVQGSLDEISTPRRECQAETCVICLTSMMPLSSPEGGWNPSCNLKACGHGFHVQCLLDCMKNSSFCPICRKPIRTPQGCSPSGKMTVTRSQSPCGGAPGTIVIRYSLHGGIQKEYHENPGVPFHGDSRIAYLPDSSKGNLLLKRLVYAFTHGLTFRIGTSLTTGRPNRITWASIHHKTSRHGGMHGFPDPSYFLNCNEELDNLGVPMNP